ncbi:hypothetical protein D3C86_1851350 [compost metagenome]
MVRWLGVRTTPVASAEATGTLVEACPARKASARTTRPVAASSVRLAVAVRDAPASGRLSCTSRRIVAPLRTWTRMVSALKGICWTARWGHWTPSSRVAPGAGTRAIGHEAACGVCARHPATKSARAKGKKWRRMGAPP